ncbi:hypothetical protein DCAR_0103361 [Daucus carota subsp. sativus]|uniref:Uncharacterized protein n=1 Tax=Daucus carota subsp. sativus TaxID=79200 RepID=A0A166HXW7_DAUCS|nr:PREDICTED: uncharacterized protein C106.07c [Daucus carota subsp. sativus]WOG84180.1 hypothetical protein DCAR_0103361 [Daucus carota subsp. sativus]
MATARIKELFKKYGKVALGVHLSVSAASVTGLYVAIKSNVDVESLFERFGIGVAKEDEEAVKITENMNDEIINPKKRNRTAELAASSGGALAVAVLCNKALFPVRVPITLALTPPISRFLARRRLLKGGV